jgi:hypothetical protein
MNLPRLEPVEYEGELVALVSAHRVHIVSPRLLERPGGDPDLRFVAYMCLFGATELSAGREFDSHAAEAWARTALTDSLDVAGRNGPANASNA